MILFDVNITSQIIQINFNRKDQLKSLNYNWKSDIHTHTHTKWKMSQLKSKVLSFIPQRVPKIAIHKYK